ncbi:MAG: ACT domain-containing protein [Miltoncostaeaceae bacterium]
MSEIVVTTVGADRPGIVAALTGALLEIGGNLADVRAALLRGSFATMLAVSVPDDVGVDEVEACLAPVAARMGLGLHVARAEPIAEGPPRRRAVLSVYGADRPGIVNAIATAVASHGANIIDLSARRVGDPPIYVLGIEMELPPGLDVGTLAGRLHPVADAQGVELTLDDEDDEIL